jgi:DNA-binding Lrp family transcriptional regulator
LTDNERDLLNLIQQQFPLETQPFATIAGRLGSTEDECLVMLETLQKQGVLREIRPVINWKRAGFTGILIGLAVDPDLVDAVAAAVNTIAGVTHNYLREGRLNLWCTLTYEEVAEKEKYLSFMRTQPGVTDVKVFASEKTYKIGLVLDV